jgi:hypothetical protein
MADDGAAPDIEHHGEVQKGRQRQDVGDVGHPKLVRACRLELAVDQLGAGRVSRRVAW